MIESSYRSVLLGPGRWKVEIMVTKPKLTFHDYRLTWEHDPGDEDDGRYTVCLNCKRRAMGAHFCEECGAN